MTSFLSNIVDYKTNILNRETIFRLLSHLLLPVLDSQLQIHRMAKVQTVVVMVQMLHALASFEMETVATTK
jgi:hypothetical protein